MTRHRGRTSLAVLLVAVAATGFWSCGGSAEGPTSPVALSEGTTAAGVPAADDGGVTASAKGKITICHKGKNMQVPPSALGGHLGHGDRLGSCAPTPVDCPCFTASGLADVAAQCTAASLGVTCPQQYSVHLVCAPGGGTGTIGPLGRFEALLDTGTCSTLTVDPVTGNAVGGVPIPVTSAQFEACRQAIVGTSFYPASCPP